MAGRVPRSVAWLIAGLVLLAGRAGLVHVAGGWTQIQAYTVRVSAYSNVSWNVTGPGTFDSPWPYGQKSDNVGRIEPVDMGPADPLTPNVHGYMYSISGQGDGVVWFRVTDSSFSLHDPSGACTSCYTVFLYGVNILNANASVARKTSNSSAPDPRLRDGFRVVHPRRRANPLFGPDVLGVPLRRMEQPEHAPREVRRLRFLCGSSRFHPSYPDSSACTSGRSRAGSSDGRSRGTGFSLPPPLNGGHGRDGPTS